MPFGVSLRSTSLSISSNYFAQQNYLHLLCDIPLPPSGEKSGLSLSTAKVRTHREVCKTAFAVNSPQINFQRETSVYCVWVKAGIAPATTEHPIVHNVSKKQTMIVEKNDFPDSDKNDLIGFISPPFFLLVKQ